MGEHAKRCVFELIRSKNPRNLYSKVVEIFRLEGSLGIYVYCFIYTQLSVSSAK